MNLSQAWVHPDARIHEHVTVSPNASVYGDVEIGAHTWIGPGAVIMDGSRIGRHCRIFPGAVIGAIPQDLKFKGEVTTAEIGDGSTIREFVTINRGTSDRMKTIVGQSCLLMAYVHVAHDCVIGNECIIANASTLAGHIVLEDRVTIEGLVAIQQFTHIGRYAFIAGTSKVRKNIPPFIKAARDPVGYAGVNVVGMTRKGFPKSDIRQIEDIYRILYVQNANVSKGVEAIKTEIPDSAYKKEILHFIEQSKNGIIRGL